MNMPVRLRITLLFLILVLIILGMVCGGVYYFSSEDRVHAIETRLTNRAITTARLLGQKEIFDQRLMQRIDSLTSIALKNKTVQAYDLQNNKFYSYSEILGDTLHIDPDILEAARNNESQFFEVDKKEAVAYHYTDNNASILVVTAGEDEDGKQRLRTLKNILILTVLAGTAFILIFGYIFSARLLLPIKKIASDVEEISAQNLARRIKTG